jgi:hypothetical protein
VTLRNTALRERSQMQKKCPYYILNVYKIQIIHFDMIFSDVNFILNNKKLNIIYACWHRGGSITVFKIHKKVRCVHGCMNTCNEVKMENHEAKWWVSGIHCKIPSTLEYV